MKNEVNVNALTNEERMCLDILQSIVKTRSFSYGFRDDCICIEKVNDEWHTYFVDRGQVFDLKKTSSVYTASLQILKEISESNEAYEELFTTLKNKIDESGIDFKKIISEKDAIWLEKVKAIHQSKQDIPSGIKRMTEATTKRNNELSAELKKIKVERLIELEESIENGDCLDNLTDIEIYCMNLASKIPLNDFLEDREKYLKSWFLTDEIKYTQELMERYSCTKTEYFDRCYTANKIRRYKEKQTSDILKERKKMIKVLNRKNIN